MARKSPERRAEMEARKIRRAQREGSTDHVPDRLPAKPTETPPWALRKIKKNAELQKRRREKRLADAAKSAQGRIWKGTAPE